VGFLTSKAPDRQAVLKEIDRRGGGDLSKFADTSRNAKAFTFDVNDLKSPFYLGAKAAGRGVIEAGSAAGKAATKASNPRSLQAILDGIYSSPDYEKKGVK
jgi:hypothetical protein